MFEILKELILSSLVNDVVNHARSELHRYEFEEEAQDLPEKGVARKYVCAISIVFGELKGIEVPAEHNQGPDEVTGDQSSNLERLIRDGIDVLFVLGICLLLFPL